MVKLTIKSLNNFVEVTATIVHIVLVHDQCGINYIWSNQNHLSDLVSLVLLE